MTIERQQIGQAQQYKGRTITAHAMSIDVLMRLDGGDAGMFLTKEAGFKAIMKQIDDEEARKSRQ